MKCRNCNANYRAFRLKCPYCGTENRLGHIWAVEVSDAEKEYERARKLEKKKYSPYIYNRWLSRAMVIGLSVILLTVLIVIAMSLVSSAVPKIKYKANKETVEARVAEAYENKDYRTLKNILYEYDILDEEHYKYSQAALLNYEYSGYLESKYRLLDMAELYKKDLVTSGPDSSSLDNERERLVSYIDVLLTHSRSVYIPSLGLYSKVAPDNNEFYESCCKDIKDMLVGYLGMTDSEWEHFCDTDNFSYSDMEEMTNVLFERMKLQNE